MPRSAKGRTWPRRAAAVAMWLAALVVIAAWVAGGVIISPAPCVVGKLPSDLHGESVTIQSASGARLRGWFVPGRKGVGAVVLLHGVRGSRLDTLGRARLLSKAGFAVLLIDLQAHGESGGDRITFGYRESHDAQAAVMWTRNKCPGEKVGVIGVSLGGAAVILSDPPLPVDAVVLEMVYPTITDAITDRITMRTGPWGRALIPLLLWQMKSRLGITADQLRPVDKVGRITAPKLFIAGSNDKHTPLAEARRLYDAASAPKALWVVPGADHTNLYDFAPADYAAHVVPFFTKTLAR